MENCWGRDPETAGAMQLATELTIVDKNTFISNIHE
jgi:hypothetical protein